MRFFLYCATFLRLTYPLVSATAPKEYADQEFQETLIRQHFERALEISRSTQPFENVFRAIAQATSYKQQLIVAELVLQQNSFEPESTDLQSMSSQNALIALYDANYLTELAFLMDCIPADILKEKFAKKHEKNLYENVINNAYISNNTFALWRLSSLLEFPLSAGYVKQVDQLKEALVTLLEFHTLLPKVVCQYLVDFL